MKFLKGDLTTSQDLSEAALSYTTSYSKAFKLDMILIKFSVNVTEDITITLDSANGASYDVVLKTKGLSAESSFVYKPEGDANFAKGDQIKVQCTNANGTGIAYAVIKSREVS